MQQPTEEVAVRKTLHIKAPVERTFSVFVEQMETWWPPTHHIAPTPFETIFIEPRVGGRWYERDAQGNQCQWGHVLAWNPPHHVTLSWHLGPDWKFNPDLAKASELELRFTPLGPSATLVELTHSKLERHGDGYEQYRGALDGPGAWDAILAAFQQGVEK